jgi:hypothetical protein
MSYRRFRLPEMETTPATLATVATVHTRGNAFFQFGACDTCYACYSSHRHTPKRSKCSRPATEISGNAQNSRCENAPGDLLNYGGRIRPWHRGENVPGEKSCSVARPSARRGGFRVQLRDRF